MASNPKFKLSKLWQQIDFSSYSTLSLIFSNLLVIVFAVIDKLSAIDLMWIYWSQSVIIGIFNFLKLITLKDFSTEGFKKGNKSVQPTRATAVSTAIFFLIHYGFFHLIYAAFLWSFSESPGFAHSDSDSSGTGYLWLLAGVFFVNYLIEFITERGNPPEGLPNIGRIMFAPYARIIPMHLTIIFGGFAGAAGSYFSGDTNLFIIVMFIVMKTVVDLITHSVNLSNLKKRVSAD